MPSTINLYQIGVWFCVGFFTGAGWAIAALIVGRIFSASERKRQGVHGVAGARSFNEGQSGLRKRTAIWTDRHSLE